MKPAIYICFLFSLLFQGCVHVKKVEHEKMGYNEDFDFSSGKKKSMFDHTEAARNQGRYFDKQVFYKELTD